MYPIENQLSSYQLQVSRGAGKANNFFASPAGIRTRILRIAFLRTLGRCCSNRAAFCIKRKMHALVVALKIMRGNEEPRESFFVDFTHFLRYYQHTRGPGAGEEVAGISDSQLKLFV